jgi:hypothetical protein
MRHQRWNFRVTGRMSLSACRIATVSIFCCHVAGWAAQAQEFVQGTGDVLAIPSGSNISGIGGAVGSPSRSAISSPLLPPSAPLNLPNQFTLGDVGSSAVLAGKNLSTDKSCLTARAYVRPDFADKALHQNWITAKNSCGRFIKISICYSGTPSCISIKVPPWRTESAIVGYAPSGSEVHYQINLEN